MRRVLVVVLVSVVVAGVICGTSAPPVAAATGANGKLTVTPATGLTPGGTITATGVTGTPSVTISVANATANWRVGTCPIASAPFPPVAGNGCDLEGWQGAGATGDGGGSLVIDLLPYQCGVGPVVKVIGPNTPPVNSGGKVALALIEGPGAFGTLTDYVELTYDCGSPPPSPNTTGIGDASLVEGAEGEAKLVLPVTLSAPATEEVSVDYQITPVSATPGGDYADRRTNGTIRFKPDAKTGLTPTTKWVNVPVLGDTEVEGDETVEVTLSNPLHTVITRATGVGTIIDDDPDATPRVSIGDMTVLEGDSGTKTKLRLAVSVSHLPLTEVSVAVDLTSLTATGGVDFKDFQGKTRQVKFKPGQRTKYLTFTVYPDTEIEGVETFIATLSNPNGIQLGRSTGTATLLSDDFAL